MKRLICLGAAAILVCVLTVLAMNNTGLKDYRETLKTEIVVQN